MPLNEVNEPIYEKNDVMKLMQQQQQKKETRYKEEKHVLMSSIYVTDGLFE